jgi:hypothetical protein
MEQCKVIHIKNWKKKRSDIETGGRPTKERRQNATHCQDCDMKDRNDFIVKILYSLVGTIEGRQ